MLAHIRPTTSSSLGLRFFAEEAAKEAAQQPDIKVEEKNEEKKPTIEELQEELKAIKNRNLFLIAEVENARRRFNRLEKELKVTAVTSLAKDLLPIADNFTRIENSNTRRQKVKDVIAAVQLVDNEFHNIFKKYSIEKLVSKGQQFDPKYHDAIQMVESKKHKSGEIVDVPIEGYMIGNRLLRAAKVVVAK